MKAKEYASRFNEKMTEDEFGKVLYDTLLDFLKEGQILIDSRGNSSNSVSGVLREMDMKWQALAGRIPGIKRLGYREFMIKEMPSVKSVMGW